MLISSERDAAILRTRDGRVNNLIEGTGSVAKTASLSRSMRWSRRRWSRKKDTPSRKTSSRLSAQRMDSALVLDKSSLSSLSERHVLELDKSLSSIVKSSVDPIRHPVALIMVFWTSLSPSLSLLSSSSWLTDDVPCITIAQNLQDLY